MIALLTQQQFHSHLTTTEQGMQVLHTQHRDHTFNCDCNFTVTWPPLSKEREFCTHNIVITLLTRLQFHSHLTTTEQGTWVLHTQHHDHTFNCDCNFTVTWPPLSKQHEFYTHTHTQKEEITQHHDCTLTATAISQSDLTTTKQGMWILHTHKNTLYIAIALNCDHNFCHQTTEPETCEHTHEHVLTCFRLVCFKHVCVCILSRK